jgi:hypothetical protein
MAIQCIAGTIESGEYKGNMADFIRLLQMQKELEPDEPREIKVTWVEPGKIEPASKP